MTEITDWVAAHYWSVYLFAMLLPFVQEDAAVIGAASTATAGQVDPIGILLATWTGLLVSDGWKYWAGRLAHRSAWAARLSGGAWAGAARDQVIGRLGVTLVAARFIPGTRIPLYIACGLFQAPFAKFHLMIMLSAALYLAIAFTLFSVLGAALGDQVRSALPVIVAPLLVAALLFSWWKKLRERQAAALARPAASSDETAPG